LFPVRRSPSADRYLRCGARLGGLVNQLDVERQLDLVTHHHTARLENLVPGETKRRTADLPRGTEACAIVAPRIARAPLGCHVERHWLGYATNGEVTRHAEGAVQISGDARAGKAHRREIRRVEEVGRTQVIVALLLSRVDRGHIDRDVDLRRQWIHL